MSDYGYIVVHRQILQNPVVCKDSYHFALWMFLLLNASFKEISVFFGSGRINLKPGQLVTGRKYLAEKLKTSESKVDRILKLFETEQMIEQNTTSRGRLITVVNWSKFQKSVYPSGQKLNFNRTTAEQQPDTINKDNNANNLTNIDSPVEVDLEPTVLKSIYGEFKNVMLTDEEFVELQTRGLGSVIDKLSSYMASTGKKYDNHYATIISWASNAKLKGDSHEKDSRPNSKGRFKTKPTIFV